MALVALPANHLRKRIKDKYNDVIPESGVSLSACKLFELPFCQSLAADHI